MYLEIHYGRHFFLYKKKTRPASPANGERDCYKHAARRCRVYAACLIKDVNAYLRVIIRLFPLGLRRRLEESVSGTSPQGRLEVNRTVDSSACSRKNSGKHICDTILLFTRDSITHLRCIALVLRDILLFAFSVTIHILYTRLRAAHQVPRDIDSLFRYFDWPFYFYVCPKKSNFFFYRLQAYLEGFHSVSAVSKNPSARRRRKNDEKQTRQWVSSACSRNILENTFTV